MVSLTVLRHYIFIWFWRTLQLLINLVYKPTADDFARNVCLSYHVLKDVKPLIFYSNSYKYFLLKYSGTKDLSWIERENVCLYAIEEGYYVFARPADECGDIYDVKKYPFLYDALRCHTVEILKVRSDIISDYIHGLKEERKTGSNVYFLHNTGRCGSTLVNAVLYGTGQVKVLSEPSAVLTLITMVKSRGGAFLLSDERYPELLEYIRNTIILSCPCPNTKYFIKFHPCGNLLHPLIKRAIPNCHQIFLYRSLLPNVQSIYKIQQIIENGASPSEMWLQYNVEMVDDDDEEEKLWRLHNIQTDQQLYGYQIMNRIRQYQNESENRSDFPAFRYEDIIRYSPQFCKKLLSLLGLSEDFIPAALQGFKIDSQGNANVSRENMKRTKKCVFSEETLKWYKDLAKRYGFQISGPNMQFENIKGTINLQKI